MAPTPKLGRNVGPNSSRLVYTLFSLVSAGISHFRGLNSSNENRMHRFTKRSTTTHIVFPILIPVLVLLSGLFAGLTLGYMSLDQTQLNVLSVSGTPEQRKYANKIKPVRENGHLLLVTLLLANMIVNETLPIISDQVLGGIVSVVVSTALIVIFSEIIPQSLFTRHGLYLGAKCAGLTTCLIYGLGIVAWPTAKLLDFIIGKNHGIIYRRVELKELILMHAATSPHGGDLSHDTAAIIGATLDLQEKVVAQAMTPLSDVFKLHIDAKLDFALLKKVVESGHSRIPVYENVEIPVTAHQGTQELRKEIKIIGILLVKQCVLLDPKDATPVRQLRLNKVPFIPQNETLLGILDKFQEGRSHIAIVSRFSVEKAKSVKKAVKQTLTQRLKERVGMDSDSSDSSSDSSSSESEAEEPSGKGRSFRKRFRRNKHNKDEEANKDEEVNKDGEANKDEEANKDATLRGGAPSGTVREEVEMRKLEAGARAFEISKLEANMPADAVLAEDEAAGLYQTLDPAIMPLGIITLEDVLEELIGEEIYDEFDYEGAHGEPLSVAQNDVVVAPASNTATGKLAPLANVRNLHFLRSLSAPPTKRAARGATGTSTDKEALEATAEPAVVNDADGVTPKAAVKPDVVVAAPTTEAATPAALEAMLLDRKRRKGVESRPAGAPVPVRPRQGPKGKFKSGPLKKSSLNATLEPPAAGSTALSIPDEKEQIVEKDPDEPGKDGNGEGS